MLKKTALSKVLFLGLFAVALTGCGSSSGSGDANNQSGSEPPECADGIDNDGDGLIDWQFDLGCTTQTDSSEGGLATHSLENGWTVLEPEPDTVIYYVSSSQGRQDNDGLSADTPLSSLAAAMELARDDYPDWVLVKRGDVFYENVQLKPGRARDEPFVIATYGDSTERPVFKAGAERGLDTGNDFAFSSVIGIELYAHTRNPEDPEYVDITGDTGLRVYRGDERGNGLLIENCAFRYFRSGSSIQGLLPSEDIRIRRNLFEFNYSGSSHSQGIYSKSVIDYLFEENILDHNGWLINAADGGMEEGAATIFNHSTYFNSIENLVYRENISLRPSSMGSKFTAETNGAAHDYLIENNFYLDGEIGIGMGGNFQEDADYRFYAVQIKDNVMLEIGYSQPTDRTLGWGIQLEGVADAVISDNLHLYNSNQEVVNTFSLSLYGIQRNVRFENNTSYAIYGEDNKAVLRITNNDQQQNIELNDNIFDASNTQRYLIDLQQPNTDNLSFSGNRYQTGKDEAEWFRLNTVYYSLLDWMSLSGETNAVDEAIPYCDATRTLENYMAELGETATREAFIERVKQQRKFNWSAEFEAGQINDWFREGFQLCP